MASVHTAQYHTTAVRTLYCTTVYRMVQGLAHASRGGERAREGERATERGACGSEKSGECASISRVVCVYLYRLRCVESAAGHTGAQQRSRRGEMMMCGERERKKERSRVKWCERVRSVRCSSLPSFPFPFLRPSVFCPFFCCCTESGRLGCRAWLDRVLASSCRRHRYSGRSDTKGDQGGRG